MKSAPQTQRQSTQRGESCAKMTTNSIVELLVFVFLGVITAATYAAFEESSLTRADLQQRMGGVALPTVTTIDKHHHNLGMDEALLHIISPSPGVAFEVFMQYHICHQCPLVSIANVSKAGNVTLVVKTEFPAAFEVRNAANESDCICNVSSFSFGEHGIYDFYAQKEMDHKMCNIVTTKQPENNAIPLAVLLGLILGLSLMYALGVYLHRRHYLPFLTGGTEVLVQSDLGVTANMSPEDSVEIHAPVIKKQRLRSLDTFRGVSLVIMVFVNYGGGGYWFFHHSTWNGLTVADLVFPWFTFIMGTSMAMSVKGQLQKGASRKLLVFRVIKRTIILFMLGLLISNFAKNNEAVSLDKVRIPGVLQKLAFTYLVVALTEVCFTRIDAMQFRYRWFKDIVVLWPHWVVMFAILLLHLTLTFLLPVPGCPRGYIGPGGLGVQDPKYYNCTGGAAAYIDKVIFGASHIYQHPTCKKWYVTTAPHDPEGILGILTSIVICFLGLHAGKVLSSYTDWVERIKRWFAWTLITGLIAGILCKFSMNDGWIPVNKNLWSLSFILGLASMAYFSLIVLYLLVDVYKVWSGAPFFFVGMNSIVVYMCHEIFEHYFPIQFKVSNTHAAQLAMAVYGTTIWTVMAGVLYWKKIFIAI